MNRKLVRTITLGTFAVCAVLCAAGLDAQQTPKLRIPAWLPWIST